MSSIKIKFDDRKFKRELQKKIEDITYSNMVEEVREKGEMFMLLQLEEQVLSIILEKYDGNSNMAVSGKYDEFPQYMRFSISKSIEKLKMAGYLASNISSLSGWSVILSPDGLSYFEKKGMRKELFEELPNNAKELLEQLIKSETENGEIDQLLRDKIEQDKTNKIVRGIIGTLRYNGLLNVSWADNTVYYAELTNAGRTYFEREKKYMEKIEKMSKPSVSIENLTNTGFLNMGNITDSNIVINNSVEQLEKEIEEKGQEDKEELKQILDEVRDYIDNINATKNIQKNTGLFKRIGNHLEKHQWFYSQIVGILGQTLLLGMGNQV